MPCGDLPIAIAVPSNRWSQWARPLVVSGDHLQPRLQLPPSHFLFPGYVTCSCWTAHQRKRKPTYLNKPIHPSCPPATAFLTFASCFARHPRDHRKILSYNSSIKNRIPSSCDFSLSILLFPFCLSVHLTFNPSPYGAPTLRRLFFVPPTTTTDLSAASLVRQHINDTHKATNQLSEPLQDPRYLSLRLLLIFELL